MFSTVDALLTGIASGPVEAVANLLVSLDGAELRLTSVTGRVEILVESLRAAVRIVRTEGETLRRLDDTLSAGGITAPVYVAETRIALLGADARPGWLSKRIADGRTEVDGWGLLKAIPRDLRRRLRWPSLRRRIGRPDLQLSHRMASLRDRLRWPNVRERVRWPQLRRKE